jgi:hypothetical protein
MLPVRNFASAYEPKHATQAPPGGFTRLHQIAEHRFAFVTLQQPGRDLHN